MNKLVIILVGVLTTTSVFATQFKCTGKGLDSNGDIVPAEITLNVSDTKVVITEDNGTQYGFAMDDLGFDENYRPSAKYAGYYRYQVAAGDNQNWNDILIQKPMRDDKRAKAGAVVFQGTEEDGGTAAYFDSCSRLN